MSKPTVLIIPGSFCPPKPYEPLVASLQSLGYDTYALPLQTVGRRPSPAPTMYDDAAFIASEVTKLVSRGLEVVIMAHSYGGIPMTQSSKGLTVRERSAQNLPGGISHFVYVSAQAPALGVGLAGEDPSWLPEEVRNGTQAYMSTDIPFSMAQAVFSEFTEEKAREEIRAFQEQAASTYTDKLTWPGYESVGTTYVYCSQDQCHSPEKQKESISVLEKRSLKVDVVEMESGHCPMITQPEAFVKVMGKILEKV